jgi:hypothetical protein
MVDELKRFARDIFISKIYNKFSILANKKLSGLNGTLIAHGPECLTNNKEGGHENFEIPFHFLACRISLYRHN